MRVAFLSPCWPHDQFPNGIASYVASVRSGLEALGTQTHVLTSTLGEGVRDPHVVRVPENIEDRPLHARLRQRGSGMFSRYMGMRQDIGYRVGHTLSRLDRATPFDLVEIEETFGISRVVQRAFQKPSIVRLHGPWCVIGTRLGHRRDKEYWIRCALEYVAIRHATALSSPSLDALERVRQAYRLELPNARVIPNPVPLVADEDLWTPEGSDPNTILFVGRFDRVKGADILLEAFSRVAQARPELRLVFIGPDTGLMEGSTTWSFETYLRARVPSQVHPRIDFRGAQSRQQVTRERRRAAITVVSSRYETFSIAAVEAMATGSPLIAASTGGINEIVRDGINALAFPAERSDELADRIERLLGDPALAARLGEAGRADARERYSEAQVAAQTQAFYSEVIGGR